MRVFVLTVLIVLFGTNIGVFADPMEKLTRTVEQNRIGTGSNYWLMIRNSFGDLEKMALVFGSYGDDEKLCEILADGYRRQFPSSKYICVRAN